MLLARTMAFGQGKVTTSRRVLACQWSLYPFVVLQKDMKRARDSLTSSLRTHRYELDQRNSCEKNMLPPPPLVHCESGSY